jgi:hypothetical protein
MRVPTVVTPIPMVVTPIFAPIPMVIAAVPTVLTTMFAPVLMVSRIGMAIPNPQPLSVTVVQMILTR